MTFQPHLLEFDEIERYELREPGKYGFAASRREFVHTLGAGLVVAVSTQIAPAQRAGRRGGNRTSRGSEKLTDRFHFAEDGTVTVLTSKVEVGQGARTQITQAAAEELRLPVAQIRLIMADTQLCPDDGGTAGSRTTPSTVPRIRQAAAAARERLAQYAAKRLGVERSAISVGGSVFSSGDTKQITLAELAKDQELPALLDGPVAGEVAIARVDQWQVLGTPVAKVNGHDVVTGTAQYPSDIVRPEMLYGCVLRPVSFGAQLASLDLAPARALPGVTVVRDGDFVGCVAPTAWQARQAVQKISTTAKWEEQQHPSSDELFEHLKRHAQIGGAQRRRGNVWGNGEAALDKSHQTLEASYTVAYIQHAPMEPRAAVAEWQDGELTVWTGTQQPGRVRSELQQVFRLSADQVRVVVPDTGGGFGGKHTGEAAVEAARLAQAAGKPVSLRWTREEEFTWAYFRPAGVIDVKAGLNSSGLLSVWSFTNYNSGGSALDTPYRVPHGQTRFVESDSPLRQGSYRALASTANTFARESAMDELATLAGADPLEFRLKHLEDGRLKDVLQAAAGRFDWRTRVADRHKNRGVGLACGTEKGSYVAACAEVEVTRGQIDVLSVCQAYECGAIQNPRNLRAQVEGCIIMGLGGAMTEEIQFKNGTISTVNFSSYQVPRISDVPQLDVVLLDRRDLPSVGAGETPIIAVAPAIANAVYQAVEVRSGSMPLRI